MLIYFIPPGALLEKFLVQYCKPNFHLEHLAIKMLAAKGM